MRRIETMIHKMNLNPEPFERILSGRKTIELRLNDEKRRLIKVGDKIEFIQTEETNQEFFVNISTVLRSENVYVPPFLDSHYKSSIPIHHHVIVT